MLKVGFVGWRGMVGSVLMQRMMIENDFNRFEPVFFSTSDIGGESLKIKGNSFKLLDAYDLDKLGNLDCIVSTQGSDYTDSILPKLRKNGFDGYWLDASSTLRMNDDSVIILDSVNRSLIDKALNNGIKNYIGGNCTVSLMIMAIAGLLKNNLVEWVSTMTYQAASGGGAKCMLELLKQTDGLSKGISSLLANPEINILDIDKQVKNIFNSNILPTYNFGVPLIGNVIPWIDVQVADGQTKEEWKAQAEGNKILGLTGNNIIPIDGISVRVGSLRCHSQALTIKLKDNISLEHIVELIKNGHQWIKYVENNKSDTLKYLNPVAVSNTLDIAVGRLRKLKIGKEYLTLFTVGDQLLWGAAEPIRRMLNIIIDYHK